MSAVVFPHEVELFFEEIKNRFGSPPNEKEYRRLYGAFLISEGDSETWWKEHLDVTKYSYTTLSFSAWLNANYTACREWILKNCTDDDLERYLHPGQEHFSSRERLLSSINFHYLADNPAFWDTENSSAGKSMKTFFSCEENFSSFDVVPIGSQNRIMLQLLENDRMNDTSASIILNAVSFRRATNGTITPTNFSSNIRTRNQIIAWYRKKYDLNEEFPNSWVEKALGLDLSS